MLLSNAFIIFSYSLPSIINIRMESIMLYIMDV